MFPIIKRDGVVLWVALSGLESCIYDNPQGVALGFVGSPRWGLGGAVIADDLLW